MMLGHASAAAWKHYVMAAPDFLHVAVKAIQRELFSLPAEEDATDQSLASGA
jgi:hypothetical protein